MFMPRLQTQQALWLWAAGLFGLAIIPAGSVRAADSPFVAAIARAQRWLVKIEAEGQAIEPAHLVGEPKQTLRAILPSIAVHPPSDISRSADDVVAAWNALQKEVSMDFVDTPVTQIVKAIAKQAGLPVALMPNLRPRAITFVCQGIPAYSALVRACRSGRLDFRLRGRVIVVADNDTLGPSEMYADVASCYEVKAWAEALQEPCNVKLVEVPAAEAFAAIETKTGVPILLTNAAREVADRVSLDAERVAGRELLRLVLKALGLQAALRKDGILIFHPEGPERPGAFTNVAYGSGIVFDSDGYIVTCASTVHRRRNVTVRLPDGVRLPAKVVGVNLRRDVAVLQVPKQGLDEAAFGDSTKLRPGQFVVALVFPFDSAQPTASLGIVSATNRRLSRRYTSAIITDATVLPGGAGGALIDSKGDVVGMVAATYAGASLGCCVPSKMLIETATALKYGLPVKDNWLGVTVRTVTPDMQDELGLREAKGARVVAVEPNSPAQKAGMKPDDVVVACGKVAIVDAATMARVVERASQGGVLRFAVLRQGRLITADVVVQQEGK